MSLTEANQIMPADLPAYIADARNAPPVAGEFRVAKGRAIAEFELGYLRDLLHQARGNISRAAARAGLQRSALHRLLARYGLNADEFRDRAAPRHDSSRGR